MRAWPASSSSPRRSPLRLVLPPVGVFGVAHMRLLSARSGPPAPRSARLLLGPPVGVFGVGQSRAVEARPTCLEFGPRALEPSIAVGVGQGENEESLALMACAHFERREQSRRNAVASAFEISPHPSKPKSKVPWDVFEEHAFGLDRANEAINEGP